MSRDERQMTFGSLFSGIGGIDFGLERAGMTCRWQVEIDPCARRVLAKHWPHVPKYGDIKELTGDELERVDLIAGGFPCQPVSLAGKRRGQDDERWLWPEFRRLVGTLRPRYVFLENVPGLLTRGMGTVLGDLSTLGHDAEWQTLPASAFGAPHLRYRVWIVAYANDQRELQPQRRVGDEWGWAGDGDEWGWAGDGGQDVAHADRPERRASAERRNDGHGDDAGWEETADRPSALCANDGTRHLAHAGRTRLEIFPRRRRDFEQELATSERGREWRKWWATEPDVDRLAHGVPDRVAKLRGLGNAVVPQCAEYIGRLILEHAT